MRTSGYRALALLVWRSRTHASSMPSTPRIIGAWNACPANPNPIRPTRTMGFPRWARALAVFQAPHEFYSGPDFRDSAHFDIHESGGEADFPDDVFAQICGNA